jgi:hypothetical protein
VQVLNNNNNKIKDCAIFQSAMEDLSIIVWLESNTLYSRNVIFRRNSTNSNLYDEVVVNPATVITSFSVPENKNILGKSGIWIHLIDNSLHFYSIRSQKLFSISFADEAHSHDDNHLGNNDESVSVQKILALALHNVTQELIILDKLGNLFACIPDTQLNKLVCEFICRLTPFRDIDDDKDGSHVTYLLTKNHLVGVMRGGICSFYDMQVSKASLSYD